MDELARRAHDLFCDFGRATGAATTPADHLRLWEDWVAEHLGDLPPVVRSVDVSGGVDAEWIVPEGLGDAAPVIVFLHGGGFSSGSSRSHLPIMAPLAVACRARVLGVNYRLSPQYRFPAPIDDATLVYRSLLGRGIAPKRIAFAGDSAGGGLVFSTLLHARHLGLPMPGAAIGIGPWVDLAVTGATMVTNAATDPIVRHDQIRAGAAYYLDGVSPYAPLASPIYADLAGLPPMLLQVSRAECFLDDARRLAGRARHCGVAVRLSEWDGMVHGWHQFAAFLPEARAAIAEIAAFLDDLGGWKDPAHG